LATSSESIKGKAERQIGLKEEAARPTETRGCNRLKISRRRLSKVNPARD